MNDRAANDLAAPGRRSTRRRLQIAAVAAALLAVAGWAAMHFATRETRPDGPRWNVVVITLDTTRADRLGCYGARYDTPAIDALAREGVRYEHCYAPAPITLPSHCSLMTGLVPPRHGVHDNGPQRLDDRAHTWAEVLAGQGYDTAAVLAAFVLDRRFGLEQGFAHYDDQMPPDSGGRFHYAQRNAEQVTEAALAWLRRPRSAPAFLWVHYFDPHAPYDPPRYDPAFAMRPRYEAEIFYMDSQLRRLFAALDEHLAGPTIVILTGDHGEGLGEHGEDSHGLFTYDSTLRVPLVVRFPDRRAKGQVVRTPVSLTDVLPSVFAWLAIDVPPQLDGRPLPLPDASGEVPPVAPRPLYFENQFPTYAYGWATVDGVVLDHYKLIRAPQPELYDLAADPQERNNLFSTDDELSKRLMGELESLAGTFAARPALDQQEAGMSSAELARLRALGYAGAARPQTAARTDRTLPDPKQMLPVYHQLQEIPALIEQHQLAPATVKLLELLESRDPVNPRGLRILASLAPEEPALRTRALACLERAVLQADTPSDDNYVLGRYGRMLLADARGSQAVAVFLRLQKRDPTSAAACRFLAEALRQSGDSVEAGRWNQRATQLASPSAPEPDWASEPLAPGGL